MRTNKFKTCADRLRKNCHSFSSVFIFFDGSPNAEQRVRFPFFVLFFPCLYCLSVAPVGIPICLFLQVPFREGILVTSCPKAMMQQKSVCKRIRLTRAPRFPALRRSPMDCPLPLPVPGLTRLSSLIWLPQFRPKIWARAGF